MTRIVKVKRKPSIPAAEKEMLEAEQAEYRANGTPQEEVIEADFSKPSNAPWSPAKLYSRSPKFRRILLLELLARAIRETESIKTYAEWEAFKRDLAEAREEVWGARPWPGVDDNDAYLKHVNDIADVFANSHADTGVEYPRRKSPTRWPRRSPLQKPSTPRRRLHDDWRRGALALRLASQCPGSSPATSSMTLKQ